MLRAYWLRRSVFFALLSLGCATTRQQVRIGVVPRLLKPAPAALVATAPAPMGLIGTASYYHSFFEGRTTANGQKFSNELMTAASRTLDFGTRVRVTNLVNSKSVVVTINDRGPYVTGRIIDLSRRAASRLGFVEEGLTRVRIDPL